MYHLLMQIWLLTCGLNVFLCLLLIFRGHFTRYRILFLSLIYELFAAPVLHFIYLHYGTFSSEYAFAFHAKKMISIVFGFGIIFEGWQWRNRCVRLPAEIYILLLLGVFVADKGQFFSISNVLYESLRYANVTIILWWIYCFRGDFTNERKALRQTRGA